MERGALGRGDDVGGGAGPRCLRDFDLALDLEGRCHALVREQRFGRGAFAEIAAGDRDPQTVDAIIDARRHRFDRALHADRVIGIMPLHRVIGEREVADIACERPEMVEARHERKRARPRQAAIGRLEPEDAAK